MEGLDVFVALGSVAMIALGSIAVLDRMHEGATVVGSNNAVIATICRRLAEGAELRKLRYSVLDGVLLDDEVVGRVGFRTNTISALRGREV
jgi:hypothetical protein